MKILVLAPSLYDSAPGMRFRMEQWARYLSNAGFAFSFEAFEDDRLHEVIYQPGRFLRKSAFVISALARRFQTVMTAVKYDAVVVHREAALIGPAMIERLITRRGVPLIYDFDDPIWLPYRSPRNPVFSILKCKRKMASICRLAAIVMAGNRLLAGYATQFSKKVYVVPSTIDLAAYPQPAVPRRRDVVTLGWTGSHSTLRFFERILEPLRALSGRRRFRVVVISHTNSYRVPDFPVELFSRKWSAQSEAADLADIDIGLAPFPESGWTPWRCHGKVLQYMAAGIPTVASNIGILPDYIQDGVTGFLPKSPDEWVDRLELLIDNAELRAALGANARKLVEQRYSAEVWAPRVGEILRAAVVTQ